MMTYNCLSNNLPNDHQLGPLAPIFLVSCASWVSDVMHLQVSHLESDSANVRRILHLILEIRNPLTKPFATQ